MVEQLLPDMSEAKEGSLEHAITLIGERSYAENLL
jgi:hypothetical protein